jgi:hypothetical protein
MILLFARVNWGAFYPDHTFIVTLVWIVLSLLMFGFILTLLLRKTDSTKDLLPETVEYILPDWCAPYLINGDFSGCNDKDIQDMDEFLERENVRIVQMNEDSGFYRTNDLNKLGDNCSTYIAIKN